MNVVKDLNLTCSLFVEDCFTDEILHAIMILALSVS